MNEWLNEWMTSSTWRNTVDHSSVWLLLMASGDTYHRWRRGLPVWGSWIRPPRPDRSHSSSLTATTHTHTHINTDGLSRSNTAFFFIKTSDPSYPRQDAAPCHRVCNQSRRAPVDSSICRKQETFFSKKEGRKKLWRKCWTSDHLMFLFFSWSWLDKCRKKNGAEKTVRAATATVIFVENVRGEKRRQADEGVSQMKLKYLK